MKVKEREIVLSDGRKCLFRGIEKKDAEILLEYLKKTAEETEFLVSNPEEIQMTREQEEVFIERFLQQERAAMILAFVDGRHAGNVSFRPVMEKERLCHRADLGIALYKEFWGCGIGTKMMEYAMELAKGKGFEQMELEVLSENERAIHLYQKKGFHIYGRRPDAIKYKDGRYTDEILMVKKL